MHRPTLSPDASGPSSASLVATETEATYLIRLEGLLDAAASKELELKLAEAEASAAQRILLDLDHVDSLDARALHVILKASRRSVGGQDRLRVTRGKGHVAQIFRLTALDRTLPFDD